MTHNIDLVHLAVDKSVTVLMHMPACRLYSSIFDLFFFFRVFIFKYFFIASCEIFYCLQINNSSSLFALSTDSTVVPHAVPWWRMLTQPLGSTPLPTAVWMVTLETLRRWTRPPPAAFLAGQSQTLPLLMTLPSMSLLTRSPSLLAPLTLALSCPLTPTESLLTTRAATAVALGTLAVTAAVP